MIIFVYIIYTIYTNNMKKIIDLPDELIKDLKILAIQNNKDFKTFIQDTVINLLSAENIKPIEKPITETVTSLPIKMEIKQIGLSDKQKEMQRLMSEIHTSK